MTELSPEVALSCDMFVTLWTRTLGAAPLFLSLPMTWFMKT